MLRIIFAAARWLSTRSVMRIPTEAIIFPEPFDGMIEFYEQDQISRSTIRTRPSGTARKTKTTGPYDGDLQTILIAGGVFLYPYNGPENPFLILPSNIDEIKKRVDEPRASVSPGIDPESEFLEFLVAISYAESEEEAISNLVPTLGDAFQKVNEDYKNTT